MKEDETIDTFTGKLTTLVNKAASLGHTMEDETLVHKLLNVVPDRYLQIVASIEQYSDLSEMTLEEAIGRLKTYEERFKRGKHRFLQERNHENLKEEKKDGETSHKNYNRNNFKKSNYDTSKLQCYKCKKIRHIAPKCPQRTKPNEQSNLVEEDLEPTLLMAILEDEEQKVSLHEEDAGYKETNMDSLWYLDNGASNHMTGVRKHFKELDEKVSGKTKKDANGNIIKHKGRLVAKGYIQEHGIDFEEVFTPVARMETIQLLLAIAANNKWEVHHLDVKSAFLYEDLKEEVYVTQLEGFIKRQDNGKVYRLIKALYGLRQASHVWNIKLDNTLKSLDFKKCALKQAIYMKTSKDSTLLIGVYVDDLIITDTPKKEIDKFKA
nr:ribonuclease H-like domain, reverse transcriptase, RNA-dependent DNA polymerase [Tanacetum cinerariifolium]